MMQMLDSPVLHCFLENYGHSKTYCQYIQSLFLDSDTEHGLVMHLFKDFKLP